MCPNKHIEIAKSFLEHCYKFLIIGANGIDEDVKDLLDSSVQTAHNLFVDIVNEGVGTDSAYTQFTEGVKAFK